MKKRKIKVTETPRFPATAKVGATRSERKAAGKAARQRTPLNSHAKLCFHSDDRDILDIIEKSNRGRLQELIPLRAFYPAYSGHGGLLDCEYAADRMIIAAKCRESLNRAESF